MSKIAHGIYLSIFVGIVLFTLITLFQRGGSYYKLSLEDRVYYSDHAALKPSGTLGHGYGIAGSLAIVIGVGSYMARKRYRFLSRIGMLKYWLEFHIFLCTLGPILILFHTSYKFGGLVVISFWSMVAVFLSGIAGRFIYIQIPHSIEGRELSLIEVSSMKSDIAGIIRNTTNMDEESYNVINESVKKKLELYNKSAFVRYFRRNYLDRKSMHSVKVVLKKNKVTGREYKKIVGLVKDDIMLNRKIERLESMQNLFKYWHVAHLPFALVMLVIMLIHVGVTILFGYRWIF